MTGGKQNGNGWERAIKIGTLIASIISVSLVLGMCPKVSEIQTTIEAKAEHRAIETRTARAAKVQHDRIDAVLERHGQLIDQQRMELKEYRNESTTNRELIHVTQTEIIKAIHNLKE